MSRPWKQFEAGITARWSLPAHVMSFHLWNKKQCNILNSFWHFSFLESVCQESHFLHKNNLQKRNILVSVLCVLSRIYTVILTVVYIQKKSMGVFRMGGGWDGGMSEGRVGGLLGTERYGGEAISKLTHA